MMMTAVYLAMISLLLANTEPDTDKKVPAAEEKVIGTVEVETGQPLPIKISFVDKKSAEAGLKTNPVSVPVKDGKFEIPSLQTLPDGYLLTTFPCTHLKSVTVAGKDIRTLQGAELAKLGTQTTLSTTDVSLANLASFHQQSLSVTNGNSLSGSLSGGFSNITGSLSAGSLLGGVKFADCGPTAPGGGK